MSSATTVQVAVQQHAAAITVDAAGAALALQALP